MKIALTGALLASALVLPPTHDPIAALRKQRCRGQPVPLLVAIDPGIAWPEIPQVAAWPSGPWKAVVDIEPDR